MGKRVTLSEKAYRAVQRAKHFESEDISEVILRHLPPMIQTFGDLEKHLKRTDLDFVVDTAALDRVRQWKRSRSSNQRK